MNPHVRRLSFSLAVAVAPVLVVTPSAGATPSCVSQSVRAEHAIHGTAWGHDVVAFLATHPELLAEFGFDRSGDLVSFAAHQDRRDCPPGL